MNANNHFCCYIYSLLFVTDIELYGIDKNCIISFSLKFTNLLFEFRILKEINLRIL